MNAQYPSTYEQNLPSNQAHADKFQIGVHSNPHIISKSEGGEFLDDAIRLEDLRLVNTDKPSDEISRS